jgi:NADH dehydrogenase FAD-containing subunit
MRQSVKGTTHPPAGLAAPRRPRVVIAGFGDTGLLVALHLSKRYEIVGITPKPCLVSGQELGTRLSRPAQWQENYLVDFSRYKHLQGVNVLQGKVTAVNARAQTVTLLLVDGSERCEPYDILVIASGVSNGFWRTTNIESLAEIQSNLLSQSNALLSASTVAIVGAGPTGVSTASNVKEANPEIDVHLFFSQETPLPGYHPKTRQKVAARLQDQGIHLHAHHRACVSDDNGALATHSTTLTWQTGQPPFVADRVLWAVGNLKPNNDFIPADMLTAQGFVKTDDYLRVPGYTNVFSVGDIADTDPLRSSARNAGFLTLAHNIEASLENKHNALKRFKPPTYRWGSILGVQDDGMRIFTPQGVQVRVSKPWVKRVLFPVFVHRMIYRGMRR